MTLTPAQLGVARIIYTTALARGVAPPRARELVAASFAESGLNPQATNKTSGAAGLYQLLSGGYRQRAQQLGGLYNPRANLLAILPDYQSYWRQHPGAVAGEAARDVERSGEGAGFYSQPLSLIPQQLGGSAPPPVQQQAQPGAPAATPSPAGAPAPGAQQVLAAALLKASRTGQYGGFFNTLAGLRQQPAPQAPTAPLTAAGPPRQPQPQPGQAPQQPAAQGRAPRLPALVHIQPDSTVTGVDKHLLRAVGELATYLGKPVTITSGYRSYQEQEALYQRYLAGGNIAAKPGQSNHERGEALDLTINGVPIALAVPATVLARFGLHNPVRGDYPHTTLLNVNG